MGISVNDQKAELEKLRLLVTSPECGEQCRQLAQYSISQLEPVVNDTALHQRNYVKAVTAAAILEFVGAAGVKSGKGTSARPVGASGASAIDDIVAGKGTAQTGKQTIGVPATQSKNPLNPVQQYDAHGNEIVYRTMSEKQYQIFRETGVMPATTETSVSPVLGYSSKYDGVTVKIVVKPGTFSELEKIGIAANSAAAKELPNMSTQTGKWMDTNARFKVEGGQMTTQLGQGKGMGIFNNNIVHFEQVK